MPFNRCFKVIAINNECPKIYNDRGIVVRSKLLFNQILPKVSSNLGLKYYVFGISIFRLKYICPLYKYRRKCSTVRNNSLKLYHIFRFRPE